VILLQPEQAFDKVKVCLGHLSWLSQRSFSFLGFFCEDVSLETLLVHDLSGARNPEPFFGTGIRFYLRHVLLFKMNL